MHLYRVIIRADRRLDGISKRTDNPNTLTLQSIGTNDSPRDPFSMVSLHVIMSVHGLYLHYVYGYIPGISSYVMISVSTPPLNKYPAH